MHEQGPSTAELIGRYLDDDMTGEERASFEARLASDPHLADELARLTANDDALRAAFELPVDDALLQRLGLAGPAAVSDDGSNSAASDQPVVIDFAAARAEREAQQNAATGPSRVLSGRMRWAGGVAMAASLALVATIPMLRQNSFDPETSPAFQTALERQPSLEVAALESGARVQPQSSFLDGNGRACREFGLGGSVEGSGIACRQGNGHWAVEVRVGAGGIRQADGGIATAAGADGAALAAAHARLGSQDPMGRDEEMRQIASSWSAPQAAN